MITKKLFSLLAVACLGMTLVSGCGNSEGNQSASSTNTSADGSNQVQAQNQNMEDMAEIKMIYMPMGSMPKGVQEVEDAVNEITEKEINTHVDIEMLESGNYDQQISLMMSSAEKLDLMLTMPTGSSSYNNMISQNQFMDISDLLKEYAPDVLTTIGDYMKATSVGDAIYAVPAWRTYVISSYIVMRTDVLEDLGLLEKAENMKSFTEYEEILDAVKNSDKWSYLAGIVNSDANGLVLPLARNYLGVDNFSDAYYYDELGDLNKLISIDPESTDGKVRMNFDTEEYKAMIDKVRGWNEKGYIYQDAATTDDSAEALIKNNVGFSYLSEGEIGLAVSKTAACGMPMTCVKISTPPVSSSNVTKFVWGVPHNATEPEAAVKFLNLMVTDARIENLLVWGVEGRDYQVKDGVATYVDGQDSSNVAYQCGDFMFGNQFLAYPWDGQPADFREQAKAEMETAKMSNYFGFSCDTSKLQNEISAVANVISEYCPSLESGLAKEGTYEEFIDKLYSSGAQKIVDEYQRQLNEWLAAQ